MQQEKNDPCDDFRSTLNRIDYLYHIKEFKSVIQSQRKHINIKAEDNKTKPADFESQLRRLLLHMIYLYYVAFIKEMNIYVYQHYCINRYGVIFMYYSLNQSHKKFMKEKKWEDFTKNVELIFKEIFLATGDQQEEYSDGEKQEMKSQEKQIRKKKRQPKKPLDPSDPWCEFGNKIVEIFKGNIEQLTPRDLLSKLEETKFMKNNVLIVGVLSSTLFPCIKFNKNVGKVFQQICYEQPYIISHIFSDKFFEEGKKDFTNSIIRFFKVLNDYEVLGITSTISDKVPMNSQKGESLLTEFRMSLARVMSQKDQKNNETIQEKRTNRNPNDSHHNSEQQDNQGADCKDLGLLKCQYFWAKPTNEMQLSFRVTILINKKISPLYLDEIEEIWAKLSEKWKVILDETKQLSGFNPGFIILGYNKDLDQLSFTDYVKCQPIHKVVSELIIATDKLIIATLVMKEVICFYERKSVSVSIMDEALVLNDGRYQNIARSICQSVKNYYSCVNMYWTILMDKKKQQQE